MLFGRDHDDDKHQFRRQEHFNKQALDGRRAVSQRGFDYHRSGEQAGDDRGGGDAPQELGDDDKHTTEEGETANEEERESDLHVYNKHPISKPELLLLDRDEDGWTYRRVECAARNTVKSPHIRRQASPKSQGNEDQRGQVGQHLVRRFDNIVRGGGIGDLGPSEGEEQKQECADELAQYGYGVVAERGGEGEHREGRRRFLVAATSWGEACGKGEEARAGFHGESVVDDASDAGGRAGIGNLRRDLIRLHAGVVKFRKKLERYFKDLKLRRGSQLHLLEKGDAQN